jgi:hypothetical protein
MVSSCTFVDEDATEAMESLRDMGGACPLVNGRFLRERTGLAIDAKDSLRGGGERTGV